MSVALTSSTLSSVGRQCYNNVTHDNLRFQKPYRNSVVNALLARESLLFLQCCVQMASPSVIWQVNSKPVEKYGDIFTLSEQGQVLYSNVYPPTGYYDCTASKGEETIMQTFVIREDKSHPCCQYGAVAEITKNKPPTDVYNVSLHQTLQLECVAKVRCGFEYMANFLQWRKQDLRTNTYTYSLGLLKPYDGVTGDYVNVSYTYETSCDSLTIMTNLTIANVSQSDLFYQNASARMECDPSNGTCSEISAIAGYVCSLIMPGTDDTSQKALKTKTLARLHAVPPTAPPSVPPPMLILANTPDSKDSAREGLIAGCTVGAFALLVIILAVVYAKLEWHIKLHFKRLLIMIRRPQNKDYLYHCYVACCRDDEPFVYSVLHEELEKKLRYRFCLPERDFPVGEAVPEQIATCLENSEYFLAVISSKFWAADWCSTALNTALRTNVKVIILHVSDEPDKRKQQKQADVLNATNDAARALNAPGCSKITYNRWLSNEKLGGPRETEKLLLKLQCVMPILGTHMAVKRDTESISTSGKASS